MACWLWGVFCLSVFDPTCGLGDSGQDCFRFIEKHVGPCGDGKTSDTRYRFQVGPGQNAEHAAGVLNSFAGQGLRALRKMVGCRTVDEAYSAMLTQVDFGGEDSTRYILKGLLSPLGLADSRRSPPLLPWSLQWGSYVMSGPNCNKAFACWLGEDVDQSVRQPRYERELALLTKRVNKRLPRKIVIHCLGKTKDRLIRRLNNVCMQETVCMGYHAMQFVVSGLSGKLPRDPAKV